MENTATEQKQRIEILLICFHFLRLIGEDLLSLQMLILTMIHLPVGISGN